MAYFPARSFAPRYFPQRYFPSGEVSPAEVGGLAFYQGPTRAVAMVAAQAPGPKLRVKRGSSIFQISLVSPDHPKASATRIMTPDGVKALRLKT